MTIDEIQALLGKIQMVKSEDQNIEVKAALQGSPHKLYDTLSSFSNQDEGGVIVFGIDEKNNFKETGVGDINALQNSVSNQCLEMEPKVRPLITSWHRESDDKNFLLVEVPGMDIVQRPCYYRGKGLLKGAYVRVGDHDEPMTAYEVYSYYAFRNRTYDEQRVVEQADCHALEKNSVQNYIELLKSNKPNFATFSDDKIAELMAIYKDGHPTLCALLVFSLYPQVFYPQLCITAIRIAGIEIGETTADGQRFIDNKRIEGNLSQVLEGALRFVRTNMKTGTSIDIITGKNKEETEYPLMAVREAILNALVHRDYSIYTEGIPVQILMFADRLEIRNPGGLYGRISVDSLGKLRTDTRNPVLATMLEYLHITENRYSGIPIMREQCRQLGIQEPVFKDNRGEFCVIFYNQKQNDFKLNVTGLSDTELAILKMCKVPRSKKEIAAQLNLSSVQYVFKTYVRPLLERGLLQLTNPENVNSRSQKFVVKY